MKANKDKVINMLSKLDENKYEIKLSTLSKGNYEILIKAKFDNCYLCKKSYKVELLRVRQVRKVPILQVTRNFCPKCLPKIDYIILHWKGREPRIGEILTLK